MNPKTSMEYRQVGNSPPDLAAMSKEEIDKRRETVARLRELTNKAEKGNKKAVPAIREILDESPDLAWRLVDLGKLAERLLVEELTKEKDLAIKEIMEHQLESMRLEIAGENPSPLEQLLAERIVATWLQVQLFESLYATTLGKLTLNQGNYHQKRLDRVHRNHLSAIRTLAQVRKLLKPATVAQINIAGQQVNMAGSPTSETSGQVRSRRS